MKLKSPVAFASLVLLSLTVPLSATAQSMSAAPVRDEVAQQAIASADISKNREVTASEGEKQYDSGVSLYDSAKFSEALVAFKEATKVRPNDAQAYFMLGMSEAKLQLYKDAVESFRRATRLKPDWPEAQFRLGVVSHVWGRSALATEAYTSLVKLNSPLANILFRVIQGEKNSAAQIGDEFWVLNPAKPSARKEPTPDNQVASGESVPVPATESAATDASLANVYRIGVGDILDIRLLKFTTRRSTLYTVLDGGLIDYPMIGGPLPVAGLTTDEVQRNLALELKRRAVEESPSLTVGVRQYASHTVSITGLVSNPGTRYLRREAVPLYVIMAESQARQDAGRVAIMRAGKEVVLDLADAASLNFLIKAGDLISVTARPQQFYYIGGKINYPGQKVFQSGLTLLQAILAAGGAARQGDNVVEISRETGAGRLGTTKFSLKEIKSGKIPDPQLQPGDRIEVVK
jgi:protein involved in polysaccharide export with SLBB domain